MKNLTITFLIVFGFHFQSHAEDKTMTCLPRIGLQMANKASSLDKEYKSIGKKAIGIRQGNGPGILPGYRDEAVILVHGFIATPFEVIDVARKLNEEGYTVYLPLIPGFGANAHVANAYTIKKWRTTVVDAVDLFSSCYKKISLIGFSLGGALVSEFVLTKMSKEGYYKNVRITSVGLLAPYYEPDQFAGGIVNWFMTLFTDEINVTTLRDLKDHPDLAAVANNPDYYLTAIPLVSVDTIIEYGKILRRIPETKKSFVPLFFSISDSDRTVDVDTAKEFVENHFSQREVYIIPESEKVPHQMALGTSSRKTSEVASQIFDFITRWNKSDKF